MNRTAILMFAAAAWLGCASDPKSARAPGASEPSAAPPAAPAAAEPSPEPACVVTKATNEPAGLAEERAWVSEHLPGGKKVEQSLGYTADGKAFDYLTIAMPDGSQKKICFDISSFFGKW